MSLFAVLLIFLEIFLCESQDDSICLIGNNLYGSVQTAFDAGRDPRTLFGTFYKIDPYNYESTLDVDFDSGIYKHSNYNEDESNYIFRVIDIGWVVTENASPNVATTEKVKLTCFEDEITDCIQYRWFWGYDSNQYPLLTVQVTNNDCPSLVQ